MTARVIAPRVQSWLLGSWLDSRHGHELRSWRLAPCRRPLPALDSRPLNSRHSSIQHEHSTHGLAATCNPLAAWFVYMYGPAYHSCLPSHGSSSLYMRWRLEPHTAARAKPWRVGSWRLGSWNGWPPGSWTLSVMYGCIHYRNLNGRGRQPLVCVHRGAS